MRTVHYFLYTVYKDIAIVDKRYFVAHVLHIDISQVINHLYTRFSTPQYQTLEGFCIRRYQGEPVDKIIGTKGFWHGIFHVDKTVLSPRPDTETLIESIIQIYNANTQSIPQSILDMGTGSGCIIISLLQHYQNAQGTAVDISTDALCMTKKNAIAHKVHNRIHYIHSDWWHNITENMAPFDIIVSNPPYIASQDIKHLQPEVRNYDPILALDGGEDGLYPYKILADIPDGILADGGYMAVEFGINQHQQVADIFTNQGWKLCRQQADLSGIIRVQIYQKTAFP